MTDTVLLGPQSPRPNLRETLAGLGVSGHLCTVTAGWQEREGELEDLREHLPHSIADLALYARCEEAFAADRGLFETHRERQDTLIGLQRLYRLRLGHALAAVRELDRAEGPAVALATARRAAISALRTLDRYHLRQVRRVHADFDARLPLAELPALASQREDLRRQISGAAAVLVAGGHVAVLLGRLRLLGLSELLAERPVVAWSAGAMAMATQVVLFHDHPPQGAGDPEVLDSGLGRVRGIVALPSARQRLALDDARNVALFARRFAPARALTLDPGAALWLRDGAVLRADGVRRLAASGGVVVEEAA